MTNKSVKHLTLTVAVVALASAFAVAQAAEPQAPAQLTGTVTCEGRITHLYTCQRNQTLQTCTLDCVQQGSKFVLMVGDKPYLLEGNSHALEALAGGTATLTGFAVNDQINVETASSVKHYMPGRSNPLPSSMGANMGSPDSSRIDEHIEASR